MKKVILAAALTLTAASAFAQRAGLCEVDMVDTRYNSIITTIRAYDYNDGCKEGMKECRKQIRERGLLNRADCIRATETNPGPQNPGPQYPGPQNPGPQYPGPQNPYPGQTGYDAIRQLINGESVIQNNTARYVKVLGGSFNGQTYAVQSTDGWNTISQGISRDNLSVTTGCNIDLCVNDSVINVSTARYVTVAGLSTLNKFVTKSTDGWNTLQSNNDRNLLAITKSGSCAFSRFGGQICVGNQVINQQNRYSTVVGIQLDGRVVLKSSDGWNTLTTNVDPQNLVITR